MQIKGMEALKNAFRRFVSHFTTSDVSKMRKKGNVEHLFSKIRTILKNALKKMKASSTALAVVLILTAFLPFGVFYPQGQIQSEEKTTMLHAPSPQTQSLLPNEKPSGTFADAECVSVFYVLGDTGEQVLSLESALDVLGYDTGNADGIYSVKTAAALRRFQSDRGLKIDGVCTEALCHTIVSLAGSGYVRERTVSDGLLADALYRAGCMTEEQARASVQNKQLLRDALILFQRSRGLNGVGESNYATLCALGLGNLFLDEEGTTDDLQIYLIASYLARFADCYPEESDLHTLVCIAATIYNRAVWLGMGEPLFSVVCSAPITGEKNMKINQNAPNILCLRAAEDALSRLASGTDPVRGAISYCHTAYYEEYAKKVQDDTGKTPEIARRVGKIYFMK